MIFKQPIEETLKTKIANVFIGNNIKSIVDVGCGDAEMIDSILKKVKSNGHEIFYLGLDNDDEIISNNIKKYPYLQFRKFNILTDEFPFKSNLILVRNLFESIKYEDIYTAMRKICNTNSPYIFISNFTDMQRRQNNVDIGKTNWRPLNVQIFPFNFPIPEPGTIISERCTYEDENYGKCSDKVMAMYKLSDIKKNKIFENKESLKTYVRIDGEEFDTNKIKYNIEPDFICLDNSNIIDNDNLVKNDAELNKDNNKILDNKKVWHLKNLNRIAHLFLNRNNVSFINYLSIKSFIKYNPDWVVKFYYSDKNDNEFEGRNYFKRLLKMKELKNTFFQIAEENVEKMKTDVMEEEGGYWTSNLNLLYYKSMQEFPFNNEFYKDFSFDLKDLSDKKNVELVSSLNNNQNLINSYSKYIPFISYKQFNVLDANSFCYEVDYNLRETKYRKGEIDQFLTDLISKILEDDQCE